MFETITNNFILGDLSSTGLDVSFEPIEDFYTNWIITISYTLAAVDHDDEFTITGNSTTKLEFSNSLNLAGATNLSYSVSFVTQDLIIQTESDMSIASKVPAALFTKKETVTKQFFTQKIKAHFRNLYFQYSDIDPLSLIYNLYEIQMAFIYYLISQIYFDLITEPGDTNELKYNEYMRLYKSLFEDSLSLLAVDLDQSGDLSNEEKGSSAGSGGLFSR